MGELPKRTTVEIKRDIDRLRENLERDVHALEVEVRQKLDWSRHVRERPLLFVGGAFGLGVVIGLL